MIPKYNLQRPFVPCAALIFLDAGHRSNTYCLRALGHEGKHNVVDEDLAVEEKKEGIDAFLP